jgi:hypothetical protein
MFVVRFLVFRGSGGGDGGCGWGSPEARDAGLGLHSREQPVVQDVNDFHYVGESPVEREKIL